VEKINRTLRRVSRYRCECVASSEELVGRKDSSRYRRKVFDRDAIERLKVIFEKVCADFEAQLVEMNGEAEHVHLLINYPPKHSVSSLVNSLKGVSSRLLRIVRPAIEKRYWKNALWSPSYFAASCGGAPPGIIKQYVEQQKTPL
jgi:putative transposase